MNLIFQIIIIAYLFFGVPFHFGILVASFFPKTHKKMSEILTNGYLFMFGCFWAVSVMALRLEWTLEKLTIVWVVFVVGISLLVNLFCRGQMKSFIQDMIAFWEIRRKKKNERTKIRYKVLVLLAVFVVISILFTRPSAEDGTLEIVHTAVSTNTMYVYNEYTGYISEYVMEGHEYSPIEMLYAIGAYLTGMSVPFMLYYIIPICLLFFFYMVLWRVGNQLFEDKDQAIPFVIITTVIYWMTTYLEGQSVVTGIFLNSWNGLTLLSCCIMPTTFCVCLSWSKEIMYGGKITHKTEKICMAVMLLLTGQLTNDKGGFYIALMLLLTAMVIIVRKGYDYGITSGRFKKRV